MATPKSYEGRLDSHRYQTLLDRLDSPKRDFILDRARKYRFTFQEVKLVSEAALDLRMWGEEGLETWWLKEEANINGSGRASKRELIHRLQDRLRFLRQAEKAYPEEGLDAPGSRRLRVVAERSDKNIMGMCPVASEETVCCNLRTIDAVENCGFGCSYCTIQTFYGDEVVIDSRLSQKLMNLELEPDRLYHLGTGQSSDSLMWGNRNGLLDALCEFAGKRSNVLLELKTKSKNIAYFLETDVPRNVILSWTLNTPTIIRNEEHFTASLDERLQAARRIADRGGKVAFHLHPLVLYQGWRKDYREVAENVMRRFHPDEVAFISLGSVTFIRPVVQAIRRRARPTKMLQMELVSGPKGKLSYPDSTKKELFKEVYGAFAPWHGKVFMYLCMEKAELWRSTFGFVYESNRAFETDFTQTVFDKLTALPNGRLGR